MPSAGLLFTPRFSWSASLVKLGFFAFVQFRQSPAPIGAADALRDDPLEAHFAGFGEHQRSLGHRASLSAGSWPQGAVP